MATTNATDKSASPRLLDHMSLGVDGFGLHHHFDARTDTVHVVDPEAGARVHTEDLRGREVDEWMAFVADKRGWTDKQYGVGLDGLLSRALEDPR